MTVVVRAASSCRLRRIASVVALAAAVGAVGATGAPGDALHSSRHGAGGIQSFRSRALGARVGFLVSLPAGYERGTARYPVVYFLHGLPAGPSAFTSMDWVRVALRETGRPAILVVPQGTLEPNGDPEYHDWGPGRNWETALAAELPRYVDARYRTIRSRSGRAIVGVSAGGYGAFLLGLHHLGSFGAIESWSGYFEPTDPTGSAKLDLGDDAANEYASALRLIDRLATTLKRTPTFLGFYVGSADRRFLSDNRALDAKLTATGISHRFRQYAGGHTVGLWRAHARSWLSAALAHLSPSGEG